MKLGLPLEFPESRVLILRSCHFNKSIPVSWDGDLTRASSDVSEDLKVDVWGSRRNIVFVEGESSSLDVRLYSLLFPGVTIRPKGDKYQVRDSVRYLEASSEYAWINALGLLDGDGESDAGTADSSIHRLECYAVESLYYHPKVQRHMAERRCIQSQMDVEECLVASTTRTIEIHSDQDSWSCAERPTAIADLEHAARIITGCPISKSAIPSEVAKSLGFSGRSDYENAVRDRLIDDVEFRSLVLALDEGLQGLQAELNSLG